MLALAAGVSPDWEQRRPWKQPWQESNLQLPHLFPPFHCTSIQSGFIHSPLNEAECIVSLHSEVFFKDFRGISKREFAVDSVLEMNCKRVYVYNVLVVCFLICCHRFCVRVQDLQAVVFWCQKHCHCHLSSSGISAGIAGMQEENSQCREKKRRSILAITKGPISTHLMSI